MSILEGWSVMGPRGTVGPVSADAVRAAIDAGDIQRGHLVKHEWDKDWQRVEVSMFGTQLPRPLTAAPRPLVAHVPTLAFWAMWAFMAYSVVDLLLYMKSPTLTLWTVGIVGFLVLYVAGMRARVGR